jgi:signal transduction histidine kinase
MQQYLNWKTYLVIVAMLIVAASIGYTSILAGKLAIEEKKKVELLASAIETGSKTTNVEATDLATNIILQNNTIPLIITDEAGLVVSINNIDTQRILKSSEFLKEKLLEFKKIHKPIIARQSGKINFVYYGESYILKQLRYYPFIQLAIIIIFLMVVLFAISASHRSLQNQVWVGLSKETAHQLGTPLSSMEGWLELLKENEANEETVSELQKDLDRLKLVADRFSKVGSEPKMEEDNLVARLSDMVSYMQKRSPKKVKITLHARQDVIPVLMSGPLFDWVIENLMRNALDAMAGNGNIDITVSEAEQHIYIDVQDDGKGIPAHQTKKIFTPGFTTKKRGWGLGLSLARRIIESYHHGMIFVKHSEVGKGTTFRIVLNK